MPILDDPVCPDTPGDPPKDMAGKMRDLDPGQDEIAVVVDDAAKPRSSALRIPSDERIPWRCLPCRSAEYCTGDNPLPAIADEVSDCLPHVCPESEIVIVRKKLVQQSEVWTSGCDGLDLQRGQISEAGANCGCHNFDDWRRAFYGTASSGRQGDEPFLVQLVQHGPACHVLELSGQRLPAPASA